MKGYHGNTSYCPSMPRITIAVPDEDHRALKLLGILEGKSLGSILAEAVRFYLRHKGAYDLDVTSKKS
jgi:hypothetical protein